MNPAPLRTPLAKLPPPAVLALAIGAAVLATRMMPPLRHAWFRLPAGALALAVLALGVIGWAAVEFRRHRTTILPLRQPTSLLERGPFRFSRNPIYLGMLLLAFVPWLGWGAVGLLLAPALFFGVINGAVIPHEERTLEAVFGGPFRAYCRRVRRWC